MEYLGAARLAQRSCPITFRRVEKTGVTIVGEYASEVVPEGQISMVVMNQLEQSFKEDNENLKNFK